MAIKVRSVVSEDWQDVKRIYEAGIETKMATFESKAPASYDEWFGEANPQCSFVAYEEIHILGWCKLSPVSKRNVYKGVGEVSIYIDTHAKGKGIGDLLLKHMIIASEKEGFWTLESKIFKENVASLNLHIKNGFRIVGVREKIAQLDGIWKDNVLLERRNSI
ncbi:N-acetyltransferase family protein [Solibacillus sp. FSL W7-1464]|uniref:GNAT family N-acetyltransferase n=1 Tax=Solibacillus sp. FSL W7-1464 TaxID=2921706 RepID=UPI0030F87DE6